MPGSISRNHPPGPKPKPIIGNIGDLARDPFGFLKNTARTYGPVVRLRFEAERDTYLITNPEAIEEVLLYTNRRFSKGYQRDPFMKLVFGNGLVTSEGEFWLKQRRLVQPVFHRQRIASYGDTMVHFTQRMLNGWQPAEERDTARDMMQLTMEIISQTIFGIDLHDNEASGDVGTAISTALDEYNRMITSVTRTLISRLPIRLPIPGEARLRQAVSQVDALIHRMIELRRRQPAEDLLTLFLEVRDEAGSGMNDQQLRDEVMTLFLAGHETTANTLSWTLYLLAQHPDVEARLLRELTNVIGERLPTAADYGRLPYMQQVLKESIRLYPPVWWISRETLEDWEVDGYIVPRGAEVGISQWVMHHDPRWFSNPHHFEPERWTQAFEASLPPYAYFPFGGGPRICIGNDFARLEATLVLATLLPRYRFELLPKPDVKPELSITLRPKHGVPMRIHARRQE